MKIVNVLCVQILKAKTTYIQPCAEFQGKLSVCDCIPRISSVFECLGSKFNGSQFSSNFGLFMYAVAVSGGFDLFVYALVSVMRWYC